MAQLIVRNLDDVLVREVKMRAARRGVSAEEEEHRAILRQTPRLKPGVPLSQLLLQIPAVGIDGDFARPLDVGRDVAL